MMLPSKRLRLSLSLLQGLNLAAFAGNCAAVSVPGRIDEQQDVAMRQGAPNPSKPGAPTESTGLNSDATASGGGEYTEIYSQGTISRLTIRLGVCNLGTHLSWRGRFCGWSILFRYSC